VAVNLSDDFGANTATTGTEGVGNTGCAGSIDYSSDVNQFKINLSAGTTYTIHLRGADSGNGTLSAPCFIAGVSDASRRYLNATTSDVYGSSHDSLACRSRPPSRATTSWLPAPRQAGGQPQVRSPTTDRCQHHVSTSITAVLIELALTLLKTGSCASQLGMFESHGSSSTSHEASRPRKRAPERILRHLTNPVETGIWLF
jgi:hypothetical protein